jgi:hypothetical protein
MAGEADDSFDVLKVGFELYRIVPFPDRGFFMDKVLFANSSPTYNTNSNGVRVFAFSGAFIAFHKLSSRSEKLFLFPRIFGLECIYVYIFTVLQMIYFLFIRVISCPQQTRAPPPTSSTTTSLPQISQRYLSPLADTPITVHLLSSNLTSQK